MADQERDEQPATELDYDVVVCGAGPAGVAAAISAARIGAKTALLEVHGCLGGVWTAGALSWVIDSEDKPGLMREIISELDRREARATRSDHNNGFTYDVEEMKLLLDQLAGEAGLRVRLHTRVVEAVVAGATIKGVYTESKSGRELWTASAFIDCTGDGDLGALAGCGFDHGHPETGDVQPMSLVGLVSGIEFNEVRRFVGGGVREPKELLAKEIRKSGVDPSYSAPILFRIHDDLFALIANHEYGYCSFNADHVTEATMRARNEVNAVVKALRSLGGRWRNIRLVATAEQIGVREGRRLRGLYTVSKEDLLVGRKHSDAVCSVGFKMDVHSSRPENGKAYIRSINDVKTKRYDIPLRALIARDVDNLFMAGRCISGDFYAHSSYRVTGNAVRLGQAAGVAAALISSKGIAARDIQFWEFAELNRKIDDISVDKCEAL